MMTGFKEEKERLLQMLKKYAFERREVTLASGQKSNFYLDCKQVSFRGEGHLLIGRLFWAALQQLEQEGKGPFAACGGMALGAVPLSSALSMTAVFQGRELPAIAARKEPKGHGTGAYLEGAMGVLPPAKILLVEDVITTGGSTLKAAQRFRDHGFDVSFVLALVDRGAGGEQNLREQGLTLMSLYHLSDFQQELQ